MLNQKGVKVTLMAGAMESTTHTIVNSHYKKYRRPILDTGAQLFEFHSDPSEATRGLADAKPVRAKFVSPHLKAMVSDREVCFIGSLNFDPRALIINTESGLVVESKSLSGELTDFLLSLTDLQDSWSVYLEDDKIRWRSHEGVKKMQPARHFPQRTMDFFYRFIPVEGQL